jgi:hypothetical protein
MWAVQSSAKHWRIFTLRSQASLAVASFSLP